jgi:hypothetical protein
MRGRRVRVAFWRVDLRTLFGREEWMEAGVNISKVDLSLERGVCLVEGLASF